MAQLLMIFRAMRPLRIYTLVPHIRRVVSELCKGFKEIVLVTTLLILFLFIFASFGVQTVGGKLAGCNDATITRRENCTGYFEQKIFVTRMEVYGKNDEKLHPKMFVPRVWVGRVLKRRNSSYYFRRILGTSISITLETQCLHCSKHSVTKDGML